MDFFTCLHRFVLKLLMCFIFVFATNVSESFADNSRLAWLDCGGMKVSFLRSPPTLAFALSDVNVFSSSNFQATYGSNPLRYLGPLTKQVNGSQVSYSGSFENSSGNSSKASISMTSSTAATASYYNELNGNTTSYTCALVKLSESEFYQDRLVESICLGDLDDASVLLETLPTVDPTRIDHMGRNALQCAFSQNQPDLVNSLLAKVSNVPNITSFIHAQNLETDLVKMMTAAIQASDLGEFQALAKIAPANADTDGSLLSSIAAKIVTSDFTQWMSSWSAFHPNPNFTALLHPATGTFILSVLGQPDAVVATKLSYFYSIDPTMDLSTSDVQGRNPLYLSEADGQSLTSKFLVDHGQKLPLTLFDACLAGEPALKLAILNHTTAIYNPPVPLLPPNIYAGANPLQKCVSSFPPEISGDFLQFLMTQNSVDPAIELDLVKRSLKTIPVSTFTAFLKKFGPTVIPPVTIGDVFQSGRVDLVQAFIDMYVIGPDYYLKNSSWSFNSGEYDFRSNPSLDFFRAIDAIFSEVLNSPEYLPMIDYIVNTSDWPSDNDTNFEIKAASSGNVALLNILLKRYSSDEISKAFDPVGDVSLFSCAIDNEQLDVLKFLMSRVPDYRLSMDNLISVPIPTDAKSTVFFKFIVDTLTSYQPNHSLIGAAWELGVDLTDDARPSRLTYLSKTFGITLQPHDVGNGVPYETCWATFGCQVEAASQTQAVPR
jgi:hypothetical protein